MKPHIYRCGDCGQEFKYGSLTATEGKTIVVRLPQRYTCDKFVSVPSVFGIEDIPGGSDLIAGMISENV